MGEDWLTDLSARIGALARRTPGGRWTLLALVFSLLVLVDYRWLQVAGSVDHRFGDMLLQVNASARPQSPDVVVIDIDQKSLEQMNDLAGSWPWPRSVHGELVDYLARQHPRAIVFDILFNELDVFRPEYDAAFADAVARQKTVYFAMALATDGQGAPVDLLPPSVGARALPGAKHDLRAPLLLPLVMLGHPETMRGGLINLNADRDHVTRRIDLYRDLSRWRFASLPGRLASDLGWRTPASPAIMLNWRRSWKHISYADLYLDSQREHPKRAADELRDKIVVIGTAAPGLQDLRLTPLSAAYPGVEILATGIDNLHRGDWLREAPRPWMAPVAMVLIALVAAGFVRGWNATTVGGGLLAATVAAVLFASWQLGRGMVWPVFGPLVFAWLFYIAAGGLAYLQERAQRQRTISTFKRFLDPTVVADLVERGDIDHRANAQSRDVTVLFSDIRGFTSLSETASPQDVVALLNRYFTLQVEVIFRHGGTLDKFIGDAIMAFWGAPVSNPDHAAAAVAAALEMSEVLDNLRSELGELGAELDIGIGLHSGPAVVGFIGSQDRLDYTAIGDTVNLASRIEGLTKGVARVLVSEATRAAAGTRFDFREVGHFRVKGREQEVLLFQPSQSPGMVDE